MNYYKISLFIGSIFAVYLMFQFGSTKLSTTDVLTWMDANVDVSVEGEGEIVDENFVVNIEKAKEDYYKYYKNFSFGNYPESPEKFNSFPDKVEFAVFDANENFRKNLAEFFPRLALNQSPNKFVVITSNLHRKGRENISVSTYGYNINKKRLNPHIDTIKNLLTSQIIDESFWAFYYDYNAADIAYYVSMFFPESEIVNISLKESVDDNDVFELAKILKDLYDDDTVLISALNLSELSDKRAANFHNNYAIDVIKSFDHKSLKNLDVKSLQVVKFLFAYAEMMESQHYFEGNNEYFAFGDGGVDISRSPMILAFGDMMLGRYVRTLMDKNGQNYIFEKFDKNFFSAADIIFANLEGPIKGDGYRSGTAMVFGFPTWVKDLIKEYNINLVSLANNHAVDQGWTGRDSTITELDSVGINWCGHPSKVDANSVYRQKIGDKTVGFICFHDVTFVLDDVAAVELVEKVANEVDYLIVSPHWGYEYKHTADYNKQVVPAHAWVDAGADMVIGHHPHVVQNFEIYDGKFIFYSLGNFVFDQYWSVATQEELAIGVEFNDKNTQVSLFPMKSEMSQSRLMTESEYSAWIEEFISYGEYSEELKYQIRAGVIAN